MWAYSSTRRKYHVKDSPCAAALRVDPALWQYGKPPSADWTLCGHCEALLRKRSRFPERLGTDARDITQRPTDLAAAGDVKAASDASTADALGNQAYAAPGLGVSGPKWTREEPRPTSAPRRVVNVVDPEHFHPKGILRVLRDKEFLATGPSNPRTAFQPDPPPLFGVHVARPQQYCELWRWLASTWCLTRTVYSLAATSGFGKTTFFGDVIDSKDNLPDEEPSDPSPANLVMDFKTKDGETANEAEERLEWPWADVRRFAGSTVIFGVSFNGNTPYTKSDVALAARAGTYFPLLARIIYTECCSTEKSWQSFLVLLSGLNFGADADLDVSVMEDEVTAILRHKRGTPNAPALLLVDELGMTAAAFQPIRYALYGFCGEVESFRLLISGLDVAFLQLLRDPIDYTGPRNFKLRWSPTEVLLVTSLSSLPESGLVQQLMSKIFKPGHLVLLRSGRPIPALEAARATSAITGGVGRDVFRVLLFFLKGRRGTAVVDLVSAASLSPTATKAKVGAVALVLGYVDVQAVLITGVEVEADAVAADPDGEEVSWEQAIQTGGFSASCRPGGYYGSVSIPTLMLVRVLEKYSSTLNRRAQRATAGTPQENLLQLMAGDTSCLGAMFNMYFAIKAGGSADVVLELFHYWWEVAASRARACLVSNTHSTRGPDYRRVQLGVLYADSLPARDFGGPLSEMVRVDASRPRMNYNVPLEFDTVESLLETTPEEELLDNAWLSPKMYTGFDSMVFYKCTEGVPDGPKAGDVVCIVINNKHSAPSMSTSVDLGVVGAHYKSLEQSFGAAWAEWSTRTALVVVTNRETMSGYSTWSTSTAARRTLVCLAPDLKRVYGEPLYNMLAAGPILFGGVKASASL